MHVPAGPEVAAGRARPRRRRRPRRLDAQPSRWSPASPASSASRPAAEAPKGAVTLTVEGATFCLPLADVIDIAAERPPGQDARQARQGAQAACAASLGNPNFVAKRARRRSSTRPAKTWRRRGRGRQTARRAETACRNRLIAFVCSQISSGVRGPTAPGPCRQAATRHAMTGPRYTPPRRAACPPPCPSSAPRPRSAPAAAPSSPGSAPTRACFGPSPPRHRRDGRGRRATCWMYGDPENHDLRAALAAHHGVAPGEHHGRRGHRRAARQSRAAAGRPRRRRSSPPTAPIRPSTSTSRASAARCTRCPTATTTRTPRRCSRAAARDRRAAGLPRQSRQSDGHLARRPRRSRAMIDALPGGTLLVPRRGLCRLRARRHRRRDRPRRSARDPDAHLLQGLRHGRGAGRLCDRRARADRRLRQGAQPFRRRPHRPGRRAGGARRPAPGSPQVAARGRRRRATRIAAIAARATACRRCPRPPISSPSIAAATAPSPAACWPG